MKKVVNLIIIIDILNLQYIKNIDLFVYMLNFHYLCHSKIKRIDNDESS